MEDSIQEELQVKPANGRVASLFAITLAAGSMGACQNTAYQNPERHGVWPLDRNMERMFQYGERIDGSNAFILQLTDKGVRETVIRRDTIDYTVLHGIDGSADTTQFDLEALRAIKKIAGSNKLTELA